MHMCTLRRTKGNMKSSIGRAPSPISPPVLCYSSLLILGSLSCTFSPLLFSPVSYPIFPILRWFRCSFVIFMISTSSKTTLNRRVL